MERRRRALGVRKPKSYAEEKIKSNSSDESKAVIIAKEKPTKEGKEPYNCQTGNVIPEQCTPKRKSMVSSLKTESPGSPLYSPGIQPVFPRSFSSPEIEVSWDWSCSQVSKDTLPQRRGKHVRKSRPTTVALPVVTHAPRLLPDRQMSEEENQERLAFYKNVLCNALKRIPEEASIDSKNNNLESETIPSSNNTTSNHISNCYIKSGKTEEQISEFLDDSANEFMFECSQAIEEKLKNGEIDTGPIINVKIQTHKHAHSPIVERENAHKKLCHERSKLKLFPEVPNNLNASTSRSYEKRHFISRSPKSKQVKTCQRKQSDSDIEANFENDILFMRPTQPIVSLVSKKTANAEVALGTNTTNGEENEEIIDINLQKNGVKKYAVSTKQTSNTVGYSTKQTSNTVAYSTKQPSNTVDYSNGGTLGLRCNMSTTPSIRSERVHTNVNTASCGVVNNCQHIKQSNPISNINRNLTKPQMVKKSILLNPVLQQTTSVNEMKNLSPGQENLSNSLPDTQPTVADITCLLDDGLDVELSNLDFDSLCCNSEPNVFEVNVQPANQTGPKMCSQQEIEVKRITALNRLMMKKRR